MTVAATTDTTLAVLSFCSDMATGRCRYRWGPLPGCHRVAAAMKEPGAQDWPDLFNPVYRASEFPKISRTSVINGFVIARMMSWLTYQCQATGDLMGQGRRLRPRPGPTKPPPKREPGKSKDHNHLDFSSYNTFHRRVRKSRRYSWYNLPPGLLIAFAMGALLSLPLLAVPSVGTVGCLFLCCFHRRAFRY